jgi:hypothetical protein
MYPLAAVRQCRIRSCVNVQMRSQPATSSRGSESRHAIFVQSRHVIFVQSRHVIFVLVASAAPYALDFVRSRAGGIGRRMIAGGVVIDYVAASRVHRLSSRALSDAEMVMNRELAAEPLCDKENTEDDRRQSAPRPPLYYALFARWSHALSSPAVGFHRRSGRSRVIWPRPLPIFNHSCWNLSEQGRKLLRPSRGRWRRQPLVGTRPLTGAGCGKLRRRFASIRRREAAGWGFPGSVRPRSAANASARASPFSSRWLCSSAILALQAGSRRQRGELSR